jgi:hypothetical protein
MIQSRNIRFVITSEARDLFSRWRAQSSLAKSGAHNDNFKRTFSQALFHISRPYGTQAFVPRHPALKRRAKLYCASGAKPSAGRNSTLAT